MKTTRFGVLIGLILIATAIAPAGQPPLRDQIAAKERQELDALKSGEYESSPRSSRTMRCSSTRTVPRARPRW